MKATILKVQSVFHNFSHESMTSVEFIGILTILTQMQGKVPKVTGGSSFALFTHNPRSVLLFRLAQVETCSLFKSPAALLLSQSGVRANQGLAYLPFEER